MAEEDTKPDAEEQAEDAAPEETAAAEQAEAPAEDGAVEVDEAELPEATQNVLQERGGQIDILLDTSMPVEIRLGEVELLVRELLQVGPGSVVTLDKLAGEPLDIYLKGVRFATGQLVQAGGRLGVRIVEILPRRGAGSGRRETDQGK